MQYFVFPILLLVYFELLGRYVLAKFNRKPFEFSFVVGFISIMAYMFVFTGFISAFYMPFYILYLMVFIFVGASLFLIIKDRKIISLNFNYKWWLFLIALVVMVSYFSYNRTLGETHGFDTLFYLNIVSSNIQVDALNSIHPHFGVVDFGYIGADYTFQAFYNFASVSIFTFKFLFSLIGLSFEVMPAFVWGFQILLTFFFLATTLNVVNALQINNKYLKLAIIIIFNLFMANLYYNNVYGFIGNNHRMYILAIASIFIFEYFKTRKKEELYLFYLSLLGLSGVSSTGAFTAVFYLFGLFFILVDLEEKLIKQYVLVLFVPACNILCTKFKTSIYVVGACLLLFIILWFLNDLIIKIYRNNKVKIFTVLLALLFLMFMSYRITGNIFDFNIFFNNYSEIADMSFDYFMFNDLRHYIFNPIVLIPLFYFLIKEYKHPISICFWILIIVFFNPMTCTYMNKINWVYYRAYDIIINQYTLGFFVYYIYRKIKFKNLYTLVILISSIVLAYIQMPIYYHPTFIPSKDYNYIYKINNDELNIIRNVKTMIKKEKINNPSIITDTFYMYSYIPNSNYLFGKEKRFNYLKEGEANYELFVALFPYDYIYDNFKPNNQEPNYLKLNQSLKESDYNILVLKYETVYLDPISKTYKHLYELVAQDFEVTSYSNDKYAVFKLK